MTTTPRAWAKNKLLADKTRYVRAALGLHPQLIEQHKNELSLFLTLLPEARYIGEVGIDGSKEFVATLPQQVFVFEEILKGCSKAGGRKIFSIHSRGAEYEVLHLLQKYPQAGTPILHWFTGNLTQLDKAISQGCWFSVGTAMLTTKKGIAALERIPRNRLLTETDGPFTKDSPIEIDNTVKLLAKVWEVDAHAARKEIFHNLKQLLSREL